MEMKENTDAIKYLQKQFIRIEKNIPSNPKSSLIQRGVDMSLLNLPAVQKKNIRNTPLLAVVANISAGRKGKTLKSHSPTSIFCILNYRGEKQQM